MASNVGFPEFRAATGSSLVPIPPPRPVNLTTGAPTSGPVPGGDVGAGPGDSGYALLYVGSSRIGTLVPDVVLEEIYEDQLQVTEHPVEDGAAVSDHAYLRPKVVDMKIGFADYKARVVGGSTQKYEFMLQLQAKRQPLDVTCGKRVYKNMLPISISVTNDQRTKWNVIMTVRLREVRISTARTINTQVNKNSSDPKTTRPPQNVGQRQPNLISETQIPIIIGQMTRPPDSTDVILPQFAVSP